MKTVFRILKLSLVTYGEPMCRYQAQFGSFIFAHALNTLNEFDLLTDTRRSTVFWFPFCFNFDKNISKG